MSLFIDFHYTIKLFDYNFGEVSNLNCIKPSSYFSVIDRSLPFFKPFAPPLKIFIGVRMDGGTNIRPSKI